MSSLKESTTRKSGGFSALLKTLPLAPFSFVFLFFFCWPIFQIVKNSLDQGKGHYGLSAYRLMFTKPYMHAFATSLQLSFFSALTAGLIGAVVAFYVHRSSAGLKSTIAMLSGVLANSGGVPLAFMFIAAFGAQGGIVTVLKKMGFDIYGAGFTLYSHGGLILVYIFFQIPLMVLVFTPALEGMRNEWREANNSLGGSNFQFIRWVLIPVLFPAFLASVLLLFASAFSAFATARALTGGSVGLVPLVIGSLIDGNVITDQANLGDALAVGMVVVSGVVMLFYGFSLRWARGR